LLAVLAETEAISQAAWCSLWHSDKQEHVIAFEGEAGGALAGDLLAALDAADIPYRRVSIASVESARALVESSRRAARVARKTKLRHDTRRAASGTAEDRPLPDRGKVG